MRAMASQITGFTIVYWTVCSSRDQRKHQSSASLAFVKGILRWPVDSPAQRASNAENSSIWWRHHDNRKSITMTNFSSMATNADNFRCSQWRQIIYIHYNDVIMGAIASHITSLTIVYSIVYSDADPRKHQSSASPVNSPHKWPVTRKMFPFDDVIMFQYARESTLIDDVVHTYRDVIVAHVSGAALDTAPVVVPIPSTMWYHGRSGSMTLRCGCTRLRHHMHTVTVWYPIWRHCRRKIHVIVFALRPGSCFNINKVFPGMGIPVIRWSWDRPFFITAIHIIGKIAYLYWDDTKKERHFADNTLKWFVHLFKFTEVCLYG